PEPLPEPEPLVLSKSMVGCPATPFSPSSSSPEASEQADRGKSPSDPSRNAAKTVEPFGVPGLIAIPRRPRFREAPRNETGMAPFRAGLVRSQGAETGCQWRGQASVMNRPANDLKAL